jgi:hypothetical protein
MARIVGRSRPRSGRGIGERMSEIVVWVIILAGLVYGVRYYFFVYRKSPGPALQGFISAVNAGRPESQYEMLASSTRQMFGSLRNYEKEWNQAHGFAARIANYVIMDLKQSGDTAQAEVQVTVRKETSGRANPGELLNVGTDQFTDHYTLTRESDGWKVVLEKSNIASRKVASAAGRDPWD